MADVNISYHIPIMEKKYGFVIPENDSPVAGTVVYGVKTQSSDVKESDEQVNSPVMRK